MCILNQISSKFIYLNTNLSKPSKTHRVYMSFVCPLYVLCMSFVCPLYVLCMSFVCPLYVLFFRLFLLAASSHTTWLYLCPLHVSCICLVFVLYLSCICLVFVLYLSTCIVERQGCHWFSRNTTFSIRHKYGIYKRQYVSFLLHQ